jgi:2-phosphosulfolactate phosphatase
VGDGVVMVIDVIRAFTTAAILFSRGVRDIICVRDASAADRISGLTARPLTVGEQVHPPFPVVDLPNSPTAVSTADVHGRDVIFYTANGTRVLAEASPDHTLLAVSAVNVGATAQWILANRPGVPVQIVASDPSSPEDLACAAHLAALLAGENPDPDQTRAGVLAGADDHYERWGRHVAPEAWQAFLRDVEVCAQVDSYPLALVAQRSTDGLLRLHPQRSGLLPLRPQRSGLLRLRPEHSPETDAGGDGAWF